jgi:hypothetical protein
LQKGWSFSGRDWGYSNRATFVTASPWMAWSVLCNLYRFVTNGGGRPDLGQGRLSEIRSAKNHVVDQTQDRNGRVVGCYPRRCWTKRLYPSGTGAGSECEETRRLGPKKAVDKVTRKRDGRKADFEDDLGWDRAFTIKVRTVLDGIDAKNRAINVTILTKELKGKTANKPTKVGESSGGQSRPDRGRKEGFEAR